MAFLHQVNLHTGTSTFSILTKKVFITILVVGLVYLSLGLVQDSEAVTYTPSEIQTTIAPDSNGDYMELSIDTKRGEFYTLQKSDDLKTWTSIYNFQGVNQKVNLRLFALNPFPSSTIITDYEVASLEIRKMTTGGTQVSWLSLEDGTAKQIVLSNVVISDDFPVSYTGVISSYYLFINMSHSVSKTLSDSELEGKDLILRNNLETLITQVELDTVNNQTASQPVVAHLQSDKGFYRVLTDGDTDSDGDGISDIDELNNNTDPFNPNSHTLPINLQMETRSEELTVPLPIEGEILYDGFYHATWQHPELPDYSDVYVRGGAIPDWTYISTNVEQSVAGPNFGSWPTPDKDTGTVSSHGWFSYDSTKNALAAKAFQQWINSPDGPEERRKGAEHRQLRLRIDKAVDYDVSQTFMKVTSLEHAIEKFVGPAAGVISVTHKNSESVTLTIPAGDLISPIYTLAVTDSSETNIDSAPAENAPTTKTIKAELKVIGLITDINNDGKINFADNILRDASLVSGANAEIVDEGTEFLFYNDDLSNGLWDKDDADPDRPATAKDDDDAQEIRIIAPITEGEVWLEHPAIDGLSFYKTRECKEDDKIELTAENKFTVSESNPLPDKLFVRADGEITFPEANPQVKGDLILKFRVGGVSGDEIVAYQMKLTIIKEFGAVNYFEAVEDYIRENNTKLYVAKKKYGVDVFRMVFVLEAYTQMFPIDAFRRPGGGMLKGIDAVTTAYPATITINGNQCFFADDRSSVLAGLNGEMTDHCHGRIVRAKVLDQLVSDDAHLASHGEPFSALAGPEPMPDGSRGGNFLSQRVAGNYAVGASVLPSHTTKKENNPLSGMGGLSANFKKRQSDGNAVQSIGYYNKKRIETKGIIFTASSEIGTGRGEDLANDAKSSGVSSLPGGRAGEIELLFLDGSTSVALAYARGGANIKTFIKGSKHSGIPYYYINTYLIFQSWKTR